MGEGPKAKLLLADRPQFGQAMRLDDQEPDDQRAKNDQLGMGDARGRDSNAEQVTQHRQKLVQGDRQQHDDHAEFVVRFEICCTCLA